MMSLSLKTKITCAVALMVVGVLTTMSLFLLSLLEEHLRENIAHQQFILISAMGESIDEKIKIAQHAIVSFAESLDVALLDRPTEIQAFLEEHATTEPIFTGGLTVFSPDGAMIGLVPAESAMLGSDFSFRPYFLETVASGRAQVSAPLLSAQGHGHPIVMFTAPLFSADGQLLAIVGGIVDLLEKNFLGGLSKVRLGDTGYFYIFASDRTIIYHPEHSRILQRDVPPGANRLFDAAIDGFEGTQETVTSRGLHAFSSFKRLGTRDWILSGNLPVAEAFAPIARARQAILPTLTAATLLTLAATWLLMHFLTAPLRVFIARLRDMTLDEKQRLPIRLEAKDEIGVLATAFNALLEETENRKRALQDNLLFHQALVDTLPIPVYYMDREKFYSGCNGAFADLFGRKKEDLIGQPAEGALSLFFLPEHQPVDVELFGEKRLKIHEISLPAANGAAREAMIFQAPFKDGRGEEAGQIGVLLDITDRKRNERALDEEKAFCENLLENSPIAGFVLDLEHRVMLWNHACAELTGFAAEEMIGAGDPWRAFYPEERPCLADLVLDGDGGASARALYPQLAPAKQSADGLQAEEWLPGPGGNARFLMMSAVPIRNSRGETVAVIETLQDLSFLKQMEQDLLRSRDFYLTILEEFPTLIWRAGPDGKCDYFNRTWLDFTGRTMQQQLADGWTEGVHPEDLPNCLDIARASFHARRPFSMEYRLRRHDGEYRWMLDIGRPFHDLNNRFAGYLGSLFDITDRRRAVEKLHIFSRTTEQSSNAIIITDTAERIEYVNPAFSRLTGYALDEIAGQTPRILQSGLTSAPEYYEIKQAIAAGRAWQGEFFNRKKNGECYWAAASISPILNEQGTITHLVSIQEDISERKATRESAHRRRILRDGAAQALHAFLQTNSVEEVSRTLVWYCTELMQASFGFLVETSAAPRLLALLGPGLDPAGHADLEAQLLLLPFRPFSAEEPACRACEKSTCPELPADNALLLSLRLSGQTLAVIGLADKPGGFTDLDRRDMEAFAPTAALIVQNIRAEQARIQSAEELRQAQKFEAIGQLAGGVAHDFNNLLTVINGYSAMLIRSLAENEESRRDAEAILSAGQKAAALTRQLLAFSRRQVLQPVVLDVNRMIEDFRKIMLRLLREDIEVSWSLADDLGRIKADPGQIEQILINLVVNARDAMPKGGRLFITTANACFDGCCAKNDSGLLSGRRTLISVRDTGVGMATAVRERIFDPFFTTKGVGRGTGLGLSTVYGIVQQSGGCIDVVSAPGEGAEFRIYLPVTEQELPLEPKEAAALPAATETVLLVEDEEAVLALTAKMLNNLGYTVIGAGRPKEALHLAHGKAIDLLITDMIMPEMNGPDLADELRRRMPGLKVLFMSGYGEFHHRPPAAGKAEAFLQKPFSSAALARKIAEAMARRPADNGRVDDGC